MIDYTQISKDSIYIIDEIVSGRCTKGDRDLERNIECLENILNMDDSGLSDADKTACQDAIDRAKAEL